MDTRQLSDFSCQGVINQNEILAIEDLTHDQSKESVTRIFYFYVNVHIAF